MIAALLAALSALAAFLLDFTRGDGGALVFSPSGDGTGPVGAVPGVILVVGREVAFVCSRWAFFAHTPAKSANPEEAYHGGHTEVPAGEL